MKKQGKSDLQKVLSVLVESMEKRLAHLTADEADAVRKEIRRIASETVSQSRGNSPTRVKRARPRSRKKSH
jgi:phage terminase Nu1 subunit (DNA packaging protein)